MILYVKCRGRGRKKVQAKIGPQLWEKLSFLRNIKPTKTLPGPVKDTSFLIPPLVGKHFTRIYYKISSSVYKVTNGISTRSWLSFIRFILTNSYIVKRT